MRKKGRVFYFVSVMLFGDYLLNVVVGESVPDIAIYRHMHGADRVIG